MNIDFSKMTDEELNSMFKAITKERAKRDVVTKGSLDRTMEIRGFFADAYHPAPNCESWYTFPVNTICQGIHKSILMLCDYSTGNYTIKDGKKSTRIERGCMYIQKDIDKYVNLYNKLFDTAFEEILKKGDK